MNYYWSVCILLLSSFTSLAQAPSDWMFNYTFDGHARDESANKNDGVIIGDVTPAADRFGNLGKALFFNGEKAGYIRIPFNTTLNLPLNGFTFSVWINLVDYHTTSYWDLVKSDQYAPIFCKSENEQFFQYRFCLTGQGYSFDGVKNGTYYGAYYTGGPVVNRKRWQMLTVTYESNRFCLYVDGVLKNTVDMLNNFVADQNSLVIGKDLPGAVEYFNGSMDDFKIWYRALSVKEAAALFRESSTAPKEPSDTVVAKETFSVTEGESIVLHNVLFVQSKTDLLPSSYPELEKLLATMIQHPNVHIEISGHTDNQGEREKNIELSESRAKKIKAYLVEKGIAEQRITSVGYGPDKPLNGNKNETERKLNRRVEFRIIKK